MKRLPVFIFSSLILATYAQEVWFVDVGGLASLNQLVALGLVCIVAAGSLGSNRIRLVFTAIPLSLFTLYIYLFISYSFFSFQSEAATAVIDQYWRSLVYLLLALLIVKTPRDLVWVTSAYVIGAMMVAMSGEVWNVILHPIHYFGVTGKGREGVSGITGHYIEFAIRSMIPLPVLLSLLIEGKMRTPLRLVFLSLAAFLSAATVLSGSRGAILSFAFMTWLFLWVTNRSILVRATVLGFAVLVFAVLPVGDLWTSISRSLDPYSADVSARFRLDYIRIATDFDLYSTTDYFFGHGLEMFRDFYSGSENPPHSVWLQAFFELGLLGLALQGYVAYAIARNVNRIKRRVNCGPAALRAAVLGWGISVLVMLFWGLFENLGLMLGTKHLFIAVGVFLAAVNILDLSEHEAFEEQFPETPILRQSAIPSPAPTILP